MLQTDSGEDPSGILLAAHALEALMTDGEARRDALATWTLELSVLWGVLPVVDQLLAAGPINVRTTVVSVVVSLTTLAIGVMLKRGERR